MGFFCLFVSFLLIGWLVDLLRYTEYEDDAIHSSCQHSATEGNVLWFEDIVLSIHKSLNQSNSSRCSFSTILLGIVEGVNGAWPGHQEGEGKISLKKQVTE